MTSRTEGRAENYMLKLQNAAVMGDYRQFLGTNLGALKRFASEEKHPDEWAIILSDDEDIRPASRFKVVYDLTCLYTDHRLDAESAESLDRQISFEL